MEYLLIQILTWVVIASVSFKNKPFGFFFMFYCVYTILILAPFYLIFFSVTGYFDIFVGMGHSVYEKVTLTFSVSETPILYNLLAQWVVFIGYMIACTAFKNNRSASGASHDLFHLDAADILVAKHFRLVLLAVSFSYLVLRFLLVPDYPILAYVLQGGGNLRDLAYAYGTHDVFYLFKPSITQQFVRILLPIALFLSWVLYTNRSLSLPKLIMTTLIVVALIVGTFKRTPIIYLILWFVVFSAYANPQFNALKLLKFLALSIASVIGITFLYTSDINNAVEGILIRVMLGEAKGEYLAYLHYGITYPFEKFTLLTDYAQKVLAIDGAVTFSERWKIATGGSRGFTSIGVIAESYVSFGYAGLFLVFLFGNLLGWLEMIAQKKVIPISRPVWAGIIAVMAFTAAKGFLSQLFTGGIIFLFLILLAQYQLRLSTRRNRTMGYSHKKIKCPL